MKVVCLPARWPAVQGFDRRVPPSSRGYCGLIAGGWRCGRLRWLHPRFLDGEVRKGRWAPRIVARVIKGFLLCQPSQGDAGKQSDLSHRHCRHRHTEPGRRWPCRSPVCWRFPWA